MLNVRIIFLFAILLIHSACIQIDYPSEFKSCDPCLSPLSYEGYKLVLNEEFNFNSIEGSFVEELGDGCPDACGWGGGEFQFYQSENVFVNDGKLILKAKKEQKDSFQYTSGRVSSKGIQSFGYGRIDVRAKFPKGQGMWPAIWLRGDNISEVGWPNSGQINIAEMKGGPAKGNKTIIGSLFWSENNNIKFDSNGLTIDSDLNDKFHVYSIIWDKEGVSWLLNNHEFSNHKFTPINKNTFEKQFHLIINLAVGGDLILPPDENTEFPQELIIDYIRFFEKNGN